MDPSGPSAMLSGQSSRESCTWTEKVSPPSYRLTEKSSSLVR